jgi:hypothetical protein
VRKLILAACIAAITLGAAGGAFAQGTVFFANYNELGTSHVWVPSTNAPGLSLIGNGADDSPAGPASYLDHGMVPVGYYGSGGKWGSATTFAQLLWANGANQPESSLQPGGQTTTFRSGTTAGRLSGILDTITGLTPDSAAATFEMVVWDNSSDLYPTWSQASVAWLRGVLYAGESGPFNVYSIGGSVNTPPLMLPPSFNIYWIPEPSAFALVGLGVAGRFIFRCRRAARKEEGA